MNDRLGGTTSSLDGGNIRYYGASPNNYVYFNCESYPSTNCELWRIIGVFDGKVKLMRNESIGQYSYNAGYTNDWSSAALMKLLNPKYESESVGGSLYYNSKSGTCYNSRRGITGSCDLTSTGIKNDITRNMIAKTTWNLGGWTTAVAYPNAMYVYERGTTVYSGNSTTWTGKIALPYPSDYGYAANFNTCSGTLNNYSNCNSVNWMKNVMKTDDTYLLTANSSRKDTVFRVLYDGFVYGEFSELSDGTDYTKAIVPVLHLNSNQSIISGDGSQNNPYQLKA